MSVDGEKTDAHASQIFKRRDFVKNPKTILFSFCNYSSIEIIAGFTFPKEKKNSVVLFQSSVFLILNCSLIYSSSVIKERKFF